jgi:hypothetical protein
MKRILLALALTGALGATTAQAQTRVSVSLGFGVPAPYVVYTPRPYAYHYRYRAYRPNVVYVVPGRARFHRAPGWVVDRRSRHHHHRRW